MKIQILVDNPNSWIVPYAEKLNSKINELYGESILLNNPLNVKKGDILCLLSCEKIFRKLHLNKHNLVVHESKLPHGKGMSPLTWQILEGKNNIPITLFEAELEVDAGKIYYQEMIEFKGHELLNQIKKKQGEKTIELILKFLQKYPNISGENQKGKSSYYPRRTAKNSVLNIDKTISEQFNLLRVCDNERYPAYFIKNDKKYFIKIYTENK